MNSEQDWYDMFPIVFSEEKRNVSSLIFTLYCLNYMVIMHAAPAYLQALANFP